jgi:hypothetical protein
MPLGVCFSNFRFDKIRVTTAPNAAQGHHSLGPDMRWVSVIFWCSYLANALSYDPENMRDQFVLSSRTTEYFFRNFAIFSVSARNFFFCILEIFSHTNQSQEVLFIWENENLKSYGIIDPIQKYSKLAGTYYSSHNSEQIDPA